MLNTYIAYSTPRQKGGIETMADDRMKNDEYQKNMGTKGEGQDFGQQTPGRNPQGGQQQQGSQHGGGQHTGGDQFGGGQQSGQQKGSRNFEDDDLGAGNAGKTGGQN